MFCDLESESLLFGVSYPVLESLSGYWRIISVKNIFFVCKSDKSKEDISGFSGVVQMFYFINFHL